MGKTNMFKWCIKYIHSIHVPQPWIIKSQVYHIKRQKWWSLSLEGLLSTGPPPSSFISDRGVCRTAPATMGLLNIGINNKFQFHCFLCSRRHDGWNCFQATPSVASCIASTTWPVIVLSWMVKVVSTRTIIARHIGAIRGFNKNRSYFALQIAISDWEVLSYLLFWIKTFSSNTTHCKLFCKQHEAGNYTILDGENRSHSFSSWPGLLVQ